MKATSKTRKHVLTNVRRRLSQMSFIVFQREKEKEVEDGKSKKCRKERFLKDRTADGFFFLRFSWTFDFVYFAKKQVGAVRQGFLQSILLMIVFSSSAIATSTEVGRKPFCL
jgi:hypothetical protein